MSNIISQIKGYKFLGNQRKCQMFMGQNQRKGWIFWRMELTWYTHLNISVPI